MFKKKHAERNRTITLSKNEISEYSKRFIKLDKKSIVENITNKTICQDLFEAADYLPDSFVDLLFIDPPYNLYRNFNSTKFRVKTIEEYSEWIESFIVKLKHILKPTSSIYFCGDWYTSISIPFVLQKHFKVRNRITWEREKGRGAKTNWKNSSEDIWFCTMTDNYIFNIDAVKINRKVIAPYKDSNGNPKDWNQSEKGNFRLTHPSNIWFDISIPFWSMPENTEHPTQKPEKLIAKLILASSNEGDFIFDPFLGSGTTSVTAKKLKRNYAGVEVDKYYACLTEKRLDLAETNKKIQGYEEGVFWERNSLKYR